MELRIQILLQLERASRKGDNAGYVDDAEIAAAIGAPIDEVKRQMDVLEAQGLTKEANTFGKHCAAISPQGILAVEAVVGTAEAAAVETAKRPIGF